MFGRYAIIAVSVVLLGLPQLISGAVPGGEVPAPTCKAVSVNYITHSLPQQCLRTSRTPQTVTITAIVSGSGGEGLSGVKPTTTVATTTRVSSIGLSFGKLNTNIEKSHASITASTTTNQSIPPSSATAPVSSTPVPIEQLPKESDSDDSPLDTANFLSFEEWRAQNLEKAGQSTENFEYRVREPRNDPRAINNALDALGEDAEIELDFGFDSVPEYQIGQAERAATPARAQTEALGGYSRSKDAGKTCKERFNYASFDCAATVHKTNPGSKGATSILVENKDNYMRNKCSQENKFFVVELCEDILVDTVVLANFEFFSSMFRTFRVSVSDRYPVKQNGWKDLGTFEARNTRQVQAFLIENPLIWARYLRVELLTHYGNEFYCPVSLLRVHGTTMMEEFKHQEELSRGEIEDDVREDVVPEAVAVGIQDISITPAPTEAEKPPNQDSAKKNLIDTPPPVCTPRAFYNVYIFEPPQLPVCGVIHTSSTTLRTVRAHSEPETLINAGSISTANSKTVQSAPQASIKEHIAAAPSVQSLPQRDTAPTTIKSQAVSVTQEVKHHHPQQQYHASPPPSPPSPPHAIPTTQESFFKTVHKRLQLLEQNATLSLQYIEDQSRILRDAFMKVEKRQMEKTAHFIQQLNTTFLTELLLYKQQYDQLWQSTVIALESQREQSEREMVAVSTRLTILADEMIFQKRMYQIQSVLLLITIGVVIFSRNGNLDTPLLQHMRTRSTLRMLDTPPSSPLPGATISRAMSHRRHKSDDSITSPTFEISPPSPDDYLSPIESNESMPSGTQSSPATPSGTRPRRSWGHQFGPKLRVEIKGRRWQRLPSPLGSTVGESYGIKSLEDEEYERTMGLDRDTELQTPEPSHEPEPERSPAQEVTPETSSSGSSSS
ncbi:UNC-like C-terminal-domain-containing protein [Morchella snyderi]|nr:UNC-like C-terminal-domain-containing protein [Morchella snyderi]